MWYLHLHNNKNNSSSVCELLSEDQEDKLLVGTGSCAGNHCGSEGSHWGRKWEVELWSGHLLKHRLELLLIQSDRTKLWGEACYSWVTWLKQLQQGVPGAAPWWFTGETLGHSVHQRGRGVRLQRCGRGCPGGGGVSVPSAGTPRTCITLIQDHWTCCGGEKPGSRHGHLWWICINQRWVYLKVWEQEGVSRWEGFSWGAGASEEAECGQRTWWESVWCLLKERLSDEHFLSFCV